MSGLCIEPPHVKGTLVTELLVPLLTLVASGFLIGVLLGRRPWFQRHVRHWQVGWWAAMLVAVLVLLVALRALLVERAESLDGWPLAPGLLAMTATVALLHVTLRRSETVVATERRILVVAAHPDDLELAAGGSIARFADRGHEVRAIIMSEGSVGGDPSIRPREAADAAHYLGLRLLTLHKYTDTMLGTQMEQMITTIESEIAQFNPDLILTHSANDQHQDHHSVHLAVLRAARRIPSILCFESPSVTAEFVPRFFVDISDYLDAKVGAVQWHANQMGKPYMGADRIIGQAAHRGSQAKVDHAEGFEVVRVLASAVGDL
jgi:LmbE family N-acetylglucosaminyl deacetylase